MDFNRKTILVFGGAGFIGSNFIRFILIKYPKVKIVNFDKLTYSGNLENLKDVCKDKRYVFVKGDVANQKQVEHVFEKYKPDFVINFAAETHVDRSIHVGALVEILLDSILGCVRQKNHAYFVAFAANRKFVARKIDVVGRKGTELRDTQTSGEKEFKYCAVAIRRGGTPTAVPGYGTAALAA